MSASAGENKKSEDKQREAKTEKSEKTYNAKKDALYDKLERRITKDGLSLKYLIYNLHEPTIGYAEADKIYRQMMEDAVRVGVTECKEDRPLEQLLRTTVL